MNKLSGNKEKYNLLKNTEKELKNKFGLTPCLGVEIEFYLSVNIDVLYLEKIIGHKIKAEKGSNQYEIDLLPSNNAVAYAKHIEQIRNHIIQGAIQLGGKADFSSKPYKDDYGNSMHIHLNFLEDNDIEKFAKILCYYLANDLPIFLPQEEDLRRLDQRFMAPTHICFGGNNRTVAIRIPDSKPRRLEHRVSAASADPVMVINALYSAIIKGLVMRPDTKKYKKIYGNAFDMQYNLSPILPK